MSDKLYGYWIYESKVWDSHANGRCEVRGFKTLDDAKQSLKSRYDDLCSSDHSFVGDFALFEYEIDANPYQYTQIFRIRK